MVEELNKVKGWVCVHCKKISSDLPKTGCESCKHESFVTIERWQKEQEELRNGLPTTPTDVLRNVTKVVIKAGDPYIYEFHILGIVLQLDSEELMNSSEFRRKWFEKTKRLLMFKKTEWETFLNQLLEKKEIIIESDLEQFNVGQLFIDDLVQYASLALIVDQVKDAVEGRKVYYDGLAKLWVRSDVIQQLMLKHKLDDKTARKELSGYLAGNSTPFTIGKTKVRFWQFKTDKLDVDVSKVVHIASEEEEEKEADAK